MNPTKRTSSSLPGETTTKPSEINYLPRAQMTKRRASPTTEKQRHGGSPTGKMEDVKTNKVGKEQKHRA
ncbi:hypothetical protein AALP_AA7G084300 [Arabis alpina]|uniref:Uncharacterized protein n=1 Tax=Arabis alpina TaxID=50452 RepID=A0A087GGR5_ARAAL|nr:hypothetical protein AALP_AA7G084300 [Arabis alpina]